MRSMPSSVRLPSLVLLTVTLASSSAVAQSGSAGGSIGNDEKSLSGSRPDRSAEPAPPRRAGASRPRSRAASSRRSGGGGGGGGVSTAPGSSPASAAAADVSGAVVVSSGRVIGQGVSGTRQPERRGQHGRTRRRRDLHRRGPSRPRAAAPEPWRRSDGCGGTWTLSEAVGGKSPDSRRNERAAQARFKPHPLRICGSLPPKSLTTKGR